MNFIRGLLVLGIALCISFLVFISCTENTTSSFEQDESTLFSFIGSNPDIFGSSVTDTTEPDTSGMGKMFKTTQDTVKAWWRRIIWSQTQRSIDIDIYPADELHDYPYANVSITDILYGYLRIIQRDSLGAWAHIAKPLKDVAKRSAYFERRGAVDSPHRGWRLIEVSDLLVESAVLSSPNLCTREIDSVHVISSKSGYDTTITQSYVTECNLLGNLFTFDLEDEVILTVYTPDETDSVYLHAFNHFFPLLTHVRSNFTNNGDGSFTGTWTTRSSINDSVLYRHAAIDVIKHSTLDGDDAYDAKVWGTIYRVKDLE